MRVYANTILACAVWTMCVLLYSAAFKEKICIDQWNLTYSVLLILILGTVWTILDHVRKP